MKRSGLAVLVLATGFAWPALARGQAQPPVPPPPPLVEGLPLVGEDAETFLRTARVLDRTPIGTGITRPDRVTLTDGKRTHRGVWKTINERRMGLQRLDRGGYEFDFRDSWKSEVAAYELDKLIGLGLVPPTVERRVAGRTGSLQMWVEAAMTEDDRKRRGLEAPDAAAWNAQMHKVRLLHQLTYNTDYRNVRNVPSLSFSFFSLLTFFSPSFSLHRRAAGPARPHPRALEGEDRREGEEAVLYP